MSINILNILDLVRAHTRATGKPVLYLSNHFPNEIDPAPTFTNDEKQDLLAAPSLQFVEALDDDSIYLVCDSDEHMYELYDLTHGDDGLTQRGREVRERLGYPLYEGEHRIYAMTINSKGEIESENT